MRIRVFELQFVAFRDQDGMPHFLSDTCVHRGGSLSKGKIKDSQIACPYHGWQYDGSGICQKIPIIANQSKIPARAKVDSYPVLERYGIVFAFLGDLAERDQPPLLKIPEWDEDGWRASAAVCFDVNAYYERSIENGLDPVHNEFVHPLQGNVKVRPDCIALTTSDWGSGVEVKMNVPEAGTTQLEHLRKEEQPEHIGATSSHHGPNTLITKINLSATNCFIQYFFELPVSLNVTRVLSC